MANSDSRARAYFERFTSDAAEVELKVLVDCEPKTFEDEQIDFKSGTIRDEDLDATLSKSLGAFANNAGGVLIFGIKADRDNERKLDYAHSLALVPNCDDLKNRINAKFRTLTEPSLLGFDSKTVLASDKGDGFLVCYIPEGTHKPYRSTRANRPYYIRIGCDSQEIPHALLRQLFFPTRVQDIRLEIHVVNEGSFHLFKPCVINSGKYSLQDGVLKICLNNEATPAGPSRLVDELSSTDLPLLHPSTGKEIEFKINKELYNGLVDFIFFLYQRDHSAMHVKTGYNFQTHSFIETPESKNESKDKFDHGLFRFCRYE